MIGADIIDGAYSPTSVCGRLSMLENAANLGGEATLLGSSYNKKPEETTKNKLRNLPEKVVICARDPVSRKRMEDALNRPIRQTADLAFLTVPTPHANDALKAIDWINSRKKKGDTVIGINANCLHADKIPTLPAALAELMKNLLDAGYSLVMLPHDTRFVRDDEKLMSDAVDTLPDPYRERLYMMPPKSPSAIKAVMAQLSFLVSGRMHAAILAMGAGTPAYCFAYQDKFEGLYSFFDLHNADLLSTPEALSSNPQAIFESIIDKLKNEQMYRAQIQNHLPEVINLSKANFA